MKALCKAAGPYTACCRTYVLCLVKTVFVVLLPLFTNAQDIKFENPSLEGSPFEGKPPAPWFSIEKTPDTQPGIYGITLPASNGSTYVGLFCDSSLQEGMTQRLSQSVDSGKTYYCSFDMAYPPFYAHPIAYGSMVIYGGNAPGERKEVLWQSGTFYNKTWKKFTAVFTPKKRYAYLIFSPYRSEKDVSTNRAAVLLDNFSDIREAIKLDLSSENTCYGTSKGEVTARVTNAAGRYHYLWHPVMDTASSVRGLAAGTYQVSVTGPNGETTHGVIDVSSSVVNATADVVPVSCHGTGDGVISINANGGHSPYLYYTNNSKTGSTSAIMTDINPGVYSVTVVDQKGCAASLKNILVEEPPQLRIKEVSTKSVSCSDVRDGQLSFEVDGGTPPYAYSVEGRGVPQSEHVIRHLDEGSYHYRITDSHSCSEEGEAEIRKEWRDCAVFMPNAFSPNHDGINDVFRAKVHDDVTDYRMAVYDRWGQTVFESRDPQQGWDGSHRGSLQSAGSYLWVLTYTNSQHQMMKQTGSLLLVR